MNNIVQTLQKPHVEEVLCQSNPEAKKYLSKYANYIINRNNKYISRLKCFCCLVIGHVQKLPI